MRIEYVSKLMGHASVKHTEIYAKILNAELDKAMGIFDRH
jgi:integrase/recombinase XerD